jgi:hypothetical protein
MPSKSSITSRNTKNSKIRVLTSRSSLNPSKTRGFLALNDEN